MVHSTKLILQTIIRNKYIYKYLNVTLKTLWSHCSRIEPGLNDLCLMLLHRIHFGGRHSIFQQIGLGSNKGCTVYIDVNLKSIRPHCGVEPGLDDLCLTLLQRMHFGDRKLHQSLVLGTDYRNPIKSFFKDIPKFWAN